MQSLTQRFKVGRSQKEKEIFVERMRSMECHDMVFAEPIPNFDEEKQTNWLSIANIIFKAHEKE